MYETKPFMITYINTCTFMIFLIGTKLNNKRMFVLSLKFCFIWMLANYATALALSKASASIVIIATSTCGIFTFLVGLLMQQEQFSYIKMLSTLGSVVGVYLLCGESLMVNIGLILGLASALCYGIYSQFLKKQMTEDFNMRVFIGYVGLLNMILMWPVFLILHYTKIEEFAIPTQILPIVLNALIGTCLSEYFWIKAIDLASPIQVTLGIGCSVPLTMLIDVLIMHHTLTLNIIIGGVIVVLSFIAIEYEPSKQETIEDNTIDNYCP